MNYKALCKLAHYLADLKTYHFIHDCPIKKKLGEGHAQAINLRPFEVKDYSKENAVFVSSLGFAAVIGIPCDSNDDWASFEERFLLPPNHSSLIFRYDFRCNPIDIAKRICWMMGGRDITKMWETNQEYRNWHPNYDAIKNFL